VSRRSRRRGEPQAAGEGTAAGAGSATRAERGPRADGRSKPGPAAPTWGLGLQVVLLVVVFAVVVLVAELAGAANLGVARGVGQIAFAIAVVYLLLRR
jgi:hypothetical protein